MKTLKYNLTIFLALFFVFSCTEDDNDTNFTDAIDPPTNLSAVFNITSDNTGLVTITPLGEGVANFNVNYGDGSEVSETIDPGDSVQHIYEEGTYEVIIIANGINGLSTQVSQTLVVSFLSPENLIVTIENDPALSKTVNISATADYATYFEVLFGDVVDEVPTPMMLDEIISHEYAEAGVYTITVNAYSAAIEFTTYTEEFEVTAIEQPLASAPTPPARLDTDVISIFSSAYTNLEGVNYFPDWGQGGQGSSWTMFDLSGDEMLQYINLSYQGIALADGTSVDVSTMEYLHLDVWTTDIVTDIETSLINGPSATTEAPVTSSLTPNDWTSIEIPISDYIDQGLTVSEIFQLKFVGEPWAAGTVFIDNIYFYKEQSTQTSIVGTWKIASEAGALGVGPGVGDVSWWNCDEGCIAERECFYNDTYVFSEDGTFSNILGPDTWVEDWQGGGNSCGTPVAPYDGSVAATYTHNLADGTVTINGTGAYIGIAKANNQGELPNVAVPDAITYNVTFIDNNTMSVYIEAGAGVFWQYKLVREGAVATSPLEGSWSVSPIAGSLAVGPAPESTEWWAIDEQGVTDRACFYDDTYVFSADGSFSNILGADTWIEGWQGGSDACGTPVAPYDGSATATYTYDETAGTVTIQGTGAYLGIPKANNAGELPNVDVPESITYDITLTDSNSMTLVVEAGAGVFWTFKLVRN
ncbi:hypothetical protein [Urechidicola croceus]|uniref:PKD domain-containing protein n=1 Tax=Urechidicola croceus TaxID=1850246 RepID=A0A1D8P7Z7_9FLAO|nr:hypothetical protein [Urechidicola croceus]AOW20696.1 hypothetical protein LPB138_08415 [Urechidicola croceus]